MSVLVFPAHAGMIRLDGPPLNVAPWQCVPRSRGDDPEARRFIADRCGCSPLTSRMIRYPARAQQIGRE